MCPCATVEYLCIFYLLVLNSYCYCYIGISNQQTISLPSNPTSSVPAENITKDVTQETADGSILKSPASVDDHFAKALGEQWTRVKKTGAVQNTVAS